MADYVATVYQDTDPVISSIGTLAKRDPILSEAAITSTRARFDPGFSYSYPGGPFATRPAPSNPTGGQAIYDVGDRANGAIELAGAVAPTWSKGGIDWSGVAAGGNDILFPADTCAPFAAAGKQFFAILLYARMPAQADWNAGGTIAPMFCATAGAAGYVSEADLVTLAYTSAPSFQVRRQTNGATTTDQLAITPDASIYGKLCQIFYCRTAAGQTLSVRPIGGVAKTATAAVGADNTGDFSAKRPRFGAVLSFNASYTSVAAATAKWKAYDCSIFDLSGGGNPLTLDANNKTMFDRDHDRVVALIADSAAKNAGISQIYN